MGRNQPLRKPLHAFALAAFDAPAGVSEPRGAVFGAVDWFLRCRFLPVNQKKTAPATITGMSTSLRLNKQFVVQKMGEKTVIFDGDSSRLHTLNETGSLVFGKAKAGWTAKKIAQFLEKTYEIPLARAQKDVDLLLKDLVKKKILVEKK